jgi:hypothetical protein
MTTTLSTSTTDPKEKHILCLRCRSAYSDEEIIAHVKHEVETKAPDQYTGCPNCGSTEIPADMRYRAAIDLTWQEWQIIFFWASNYARKVGEVTQPIMESILNEVRRQYPDAPSLSLFEELQAVANAGHSVQLIEREGEGTKETTFEKRVLN